MENYYSLLQGLNRSVLLTVPEIVIDDCVRGLDPLDNVIRWIEIRGNTDAASDFSANQCAETIESVLTGASHAMLPGQFIALRLMGDGRRLYVRMGCAGNILGVVTSSLQAMYPGIHLAQPEQEVLPQMNCGGILTGYATFSEKAAGDSGELPVDKLLRGIGKRPFCVTVIAKVENNRQNVEADLGWLMERRATVAGDAERQFSDPNGMSYKTMDCAAQAYIEALEKVSKVWNYGLRSAMWTVEVFYAAQDAFTADHLGGLLCATMNGNAEELIEAVTTRRLRYKDGRYALHYNPIIMGRGFLDAVGSASPINTNPLATRMSTRELSRLMTLPRNEYAGYYVDRYVQFDVDNRPGRRDSGSYCLGEIVRSCQNDAPSEGDYAVQTDDLTRHALIIGLTGGGKSNTAKGLLKTLWQEQKVPFLVVESAKREYWEMSMLANDNGCRVFPQLNVFTVGDENNTTASPFRLNPMEVTPGVSLQTHIDYLLAAFKAAFELYPPMPYVLETAVYKVYEDRGWDIVTGENRLGMRRYPMLEDLQAAVVEVTDNLHYDGEVASNVKAALTARINSLMVGSKNAMMNTPNSIDMGYLLSRPTVLELEDLGDDDTKAFVMGILLVKIYEYRKANQFITENRLGGGKKLNHVIMIEEAHRLLKNVTGGGEGNQSRANAVEFFCNMLAEIRSFGQGFFIADQVPTKLAPDTLKNTNLKIVHRTVMKEDREAVGESMNMNDAQISYLSALKVGYAAVFSEGDNRPKLVHFPLQENAEKVDRSVFIQDCRARIQSECPTAFARDEGSPACRWCADCCRHSAAADALLESCGGLGNALMTLEGLGGAGAAQAQNNFLQMFCGNALREVQLCVAGKLLARARLDDVQRRTTMNELIRLMTAEEREG